MKPLWAIILVGLSLGLISFGQPLPSRADGVKTHYKQYSIFTYENEDYLCEPYRVKKDDWLYKIFRQKGEISASDFPRFLTIFQKINPQLNNIDAIAPGIQILIPLKRVDKKAYVQKEDGMVEVPVLEFSLNLDEKNLAAFIHKHSVKKGDTVSTLLGKEFLKKGGAVSDIGKKTFTRLNPDIQDINQIYPGAHVLVPDPDILSQPWFETLLAQGLPDISQQLMSKKQGNAPLPILSPQDLGRLKRYAQLIQGTLMHEGKIYFPGQKGDSAKMLDLSKTPILEDPTGKKTLILPEKASKASLDKDLVAAMKAYWKEIQLEELNTTLSRKSIFFNKEAMNEVPKSQKALVKALVSATPFSYEADAHFPILLKNIEMTVSLGRITHDNKPDLLVNTGSVYGMALELVKKNGYEILNLSPDLTFGETALMLFAKLGYTTWKNPSFNSNGRVETISGIYVNAQMEKYFITRTPPLERAESFLKNEGITLLNLGEDPAL